MNQIFKVVFNQVLGRQVVVSELASSVQRGACKAVVVAALAVAAGAAWAADHTFSNATTTQATNSEKDNGSTISTADSAYGSIASGYAQGSGKIYTYDGYGSTASGFANDNSLIYTGDHAFGATASGYATNRSQISIDQLAYGSTAWGYAKEDSQIYIAPYASGNSASGYARKGTIAVSTHARGSVARGVVANNSSEDSYIRVGGATYSDGSTALGAVGNSGGTIYVDGGSHGVMARGYVDNAVVAFTQVLVQMVPPLRALLMEVQSL